MGRAARGLKTGERREGRVRQRRRGREDWKGNERWEVGGWERRHWRGVEVSDLVEEVERGGWDGSVGPSKVKLLLSEGGCRIGGSLFGDLDRFLVRRWSRHAWLGRLRIVSLFGDSLGSPVELGGRGEGGLVSFSNFLDLILVDNVNDLLVRDLIVVLNF